MASPTLSFNTALITGGGGGIGLALAKWLLLEEKKKVIIVGRTESKLKEASAIHLHNCPYYVLDTGDVAAMPAIIERIRAEHADLDCLINNAGVQRPLDLHDLDLAKADAEIDINIRGPLHLTSLLLPQVRQHPHPVIVNVSSVLGFVPFAPINPVYNGTKAWLHFYTTNLRTQLRDTGVRVVELAPPTVATDLHREREDPDDNKKEKNAQALSVEEFVEDVKVQWRQGVETIGAGMSKEIVAKWDGEFGMQYRKMVGEEGK